MLTGELLKCGLCGGPMYGASTFGGTPVPHYSCKRLNGNGCGRITIAVERADEMVMVRLVDFLNSKEFRARKAKLDKDNPGVNAAVLESARVHKRLTELAELLGDGDMTKADYVAARRKLEPRMKGADAALEAAQAELAGLSDLARFAAGGAIEWSFGDKWRELGLEARRRAVLALVERVTIQPHKGPFQWADPDRVEVSFCA